MKTDLAEIDAPAEVANGFEDPILSREITIIEILTRLLLHKRLILWATGAAVLIGVILAFVLPVKYAATAKIMPPQQTQSSASMLMSQLMASTGAGSLAALAGGELGLKNPNDIYVGLLNSRPIADDIIEKFGLKSVYGSKDMTAARKKLAKYTNINSEKSGLIVITVIDGDKKRAAAAANAYVDELRALTRNLAVTEASQRRLFYEEQLKDAQESLLTAEESFQRVQVNKGLVSLDAQARAMIEGLAELRARAAAKQIELQAMRSYSTDRNPDVELAERELASIQNEITQMQQRNHSAQLPNLGLEDVPSAGMDYLRAEHDVKYRQAIFDILLRQYDAAKLDESKEAAIIQVVEPAIEPDRRSSPQRTLLVLGLAFVAFLGSIAYVLIHESLAAARQDPAVAAQFLRLHQALRVRRSSS